MFILYWHSQKWLGRIFVWLRGYLLSCGINSYRSDGCPVTKHLDQRFVHIRRPHWNISWNQKICTNKGEYLIHLQILINFSIKKICKLGNNQQVVYIIVPWVPFSRIFNTSLDLVQRTQNASITDGFQRYTFKGSNPCRINLHCLPSTLHKGYGSS